MPFYTYIIEAVRMSKTHWNKPLNDTIIYYVGFTNDLKKRWKEHRAHTKSNFMTRMNIAPRRLIYAEEHPTAFEARMREGQIKKLPKQTKKEMIDSNKNVVIQNGNTWTFKDEERYLEQEAESMNGMK